MGTHARAKPRFIARAQNDAANTRLSSTPDEGTEENKPRVRATDLLIYAVLVLAGLAFLLPFYWMVVSSFRPTAQFFQLPIPLVPNPPSLENFETLFTRSQFGRGLVNSAFLAVVAVILQVGFCALAGYTFAKLRFRGRDALYLGILTTMMIPLGVGLIPNFIIMARIGWVDTYQALIIPGIANAFGIFWMRQYCLSLPDELLDAARVDGAGEFGIFSRIVLPVIRPALASLAIFVFLSSWNDFLRPLVFLRSEEKFTVQLWLSIVEREGNVSQPAIVMAGSLLASIPIVILFAALQRHFITAGSVK
ncbi:MAG: carbohydrate transporter permease [Thermomicrobiales bacterium]|nr:carbohydrate transporter permease [Thermomicrobiales bacterium]